MKLSRLLLLLFITIPIIEIYFLISVGKVIGVGWTLLLIVLTAIIGTQLLKHQGLHTLQKAQLMMQQGQMPAMALFEGLILLISGILLVTPGFFTDAIGFLCLIPVTRQLIVSLVLRNLVSKMPPEPSSTPQSHTSQTIEGEYSKED